MLTVTHKAVDEGGFAAWVKTSSPGQACLYHEGDLASDRLHEDGKSLQAIKAMKVHTLALVASKAAADGLVHLVQRRIEANHYEYIAVRRSSKSERSVQPESAVAA